MARKSAWVRSPSRQRKLQPKIPDVLKLELSKTAAEFTETYLRPRNIKDPPKNPQFNYVTDVYIKWFGSTLFFCAGYCVPGPNALVPNFEHRFARMRYSGDNRFELSFRRYTDEWVELYTGQTPGECLEAIKTEPFFEVP
jgi:hypothetical protein